MAEASLSRRALFAVAAAVPVLAAAPTAHAEDARFLAWEAEGARLAGLADPSSDDEDAYDAQMIAATAYDDLILETHATSRAAILVKLRLLVSEANEPRWASSIEDTLAFVGAL